MKKRRVLKEVIKKNIGAIILYLIITIVNLSLFSLYRIMLEPFFYGEVIISVFLIIFLVARFFQEKKKEQEMENAVRSFVWDRKSIPEATNWIEEQYQEIIKSFSSRVDEIEHDYENDKREMIDYYTSWVHQIKTPIAVLKLKTPADDIEMTTELFRIEQYVDMVMSYIKLGSEANDLVITECNVEEVVRDTVRKFASQFILKHIELEIKSKPIVWITDKKWLSCILEQLISNALKYTTSGKITVEILENSISVIDTGKGIMKEDIPRIFERGYTGLNGRENRHSSGLGLYLAKKASDKINLQINVESTVNVGSKFTIEQNKLES